MRDDTIYLRHIAANIETVTRYLSRTGDAPDRKLFFEDTLTQDAVLRRMKLVADATSHLSDMLKARHPEHSWREFSDLLDMLAHGYLDTDLDSVWNAVVVRLPALRAIVAEELVGVQATD